MLQKKEFLNKSLITEKEFEKSNLDWNLLLDIYEHYKQIKNDLQPILDYFANYFQKIKNVNTVKTRVKNEDRLVAKLIRYASNGKIADKLTIDNYHIFINDLIGVRLIYAFKSDWFQIHKEILKNFEKQIEGKPIIYYKQEELSEYKKLDFINEFDLKISPFGYRSINYCMSHSLACKKYSVDLQLLPIFEDAWNTIYDSIKARRDANIPIVNSYLKVLKDLANNADNLSSHILYTRDAFLSKQDGQVIDITSHHDSEKTKELKKALAQNKIEIVLKHLLEDNNEQYTDEIIMISNNYNHITSQINMGIIEFETSSIHQNRIIKALLAIINKIEKE